MPIVFNFLHCSNAQSLFWHSRQFLDCDILWNQKNKLHLPSTHWHRIPFPIPKEKWGHSEEDWTMARLKPSRANTKSGSSVSDTWASVSKAFDVTFSLQLFIHLSLWLLPLPMCSSAWQMSHYLGISTSCHLKGQPRRHPHSSMQWTVVSSALGLRLCRT